jgi:hypothetical protein
MPKGLALVREDEARAYFAYPSFMYWAIAIVGWACAVLALLYFDGARGWLYFGMMVILGGVGTWFALWREDLDLDIIHRRYCHHKGTWPALQTRQGSFDQIPGIFLATETRVRNNRAYTVWVVRLPLPGEKGGLTIFAFDDENEARGHLKALSSRLHLPVIDCPADPRKSLSSGILARPLAESRTGAESQNVAEFSWQPPTGRIVVSGKAPHRIIDLSPQAGIGSTFLIGTATVFCFCIATYIILVNFVGMRVRQDTPRETLLIIVLSCLIASALIVFGLALASIGERIEEDGSNLCFATRILGRSRPFIALKKREIISVTLEAAVGVSGRGSGVFPNAGSLMRRVPIRRGSGKQEQVVVLSQVAAARVGVQLTPAERAWLCKALLTMILSTGAAIRDGSKV